MKHLIFLSFALFSIQINAETIKSVTIEEPINNEDFQIESNCSMSESGEKVFISFVHELIPDQNKVAAFYKSILLKLQNKFTATPELSYDKLIMYETELKPLRHASFSTKLKNAFNYNQDCKDKFDSFKNSTHKINIKMTQHDRGYYYNCNKTCFQSFEYLVDSTLTSKLENGTIISSKVTTLSPSIYSEIETESKFCRNVGFYECPKWD